MPKIIPTPTAVLTASSTEFEVPYTLLLDTSKSLPNNIGTGAIVKRTYWSTPSLQITDNRDKTATVQITEPGNYVLFVTVQNTRGGTSTASISVTAKDPFKTLLAGKVVGLPVEDQMAVIEEIHLKGYRTSVELSTYDGGNVKAIDEALDRDLAVILTICNEPAGQTRYFPTDLVKYEKDLRKFLDIYVPIFKASANPNDHWFKCENEPTTDAFYFQTQNGQRSINYYIEELKVFARVCNEYGLNCCDGGLFFEWVLQIKNNGRLKPNGEDIKTLLYALKDIPTTGINNHFAVKGGTFPNIGEASDFERLVTGKQIILSDEHHYEDSDPATVTTVIQSAQRSKLQVCCVWLGDTTGNGGDAFNNGTQLTAMGNALAKEAQANI